MAMMRWFSPAQRLLATVVLLLVRVDHASSFLSRSAQCKYPLPFGWPPDERKRLQQCWAIEKINGAYVTFSKDVPPYRPPSNLADEEIRSLKPDERFRYRIRQLLEYKAEHGHLNVKRAQDAGLYNWIVTQRNEYRVYSNRAARKHSFLTRERIEQLTKIGFDWRADQEEGLTPSWLAWYEKLKQYEAVHGHVRVAKEEDPALHKWVSNQRQAYSRWKRRVGPSMGMTQARCDKLESLGMVWSMRKSGLTRYDYQWKSRLQELIEFKKQHGHLLVPRQDPLGEWMSHQRKQYKDKIKYNVSALTEEREMQLREIGFDFDGKRSWMNGKWQQRYQQLQDFYQKHNHTNVPSSEKTLRNWVSIQRTEYNRLQAGKPSSITHDQVAALESLGFQWDLRFSKWMEQYEKLKQFHQKHNNTLVPTNYPEDPSFGKWVTMQRSYYRRTKRGEELRRLSDKQINLLEELSFQEYVDVSNTRRTYGHALAWDKMVKELMEFKAEHGHCRVPQAYKKSNRLGLWVTNQRRQYRLLQDNRTSSLTPERMQVLDDMGFEWPAERARKQNETWYARLQELKDFNEEHGTFAVPRTYAKNPKLRNWYQNARQQYRLYKQNEPSRLSRERVEALDAIGFEGGFSHDGKWNSFLEDLKEYYALHGHARVPLSYPENPKLGGWVNRQRVDYQRLKQGKPSAMTPERIRLLEEYDFEWVVTRGTSFDGVECSDGGSREVTWNSFLRDLKRFHDENGHCRVPTSDYPDNPKLSTWVSRQRQQYRNLKEGKPSSLTPERIRQLQDLDFEWKIVPGKKKE